MGDYIGIGVTTRNRREIAQVTIDNIKEFLPEKSRLVIVDDCSDIPFAGADFRFNKNVGISKAKNKCIELLDGCEHVFLFDDDCYPVVKDWYLPYINSDVNHLSFTFDRLVDGRHNGNKKIKEVGKYIIYGNPCGCMLYFKKICFDRVGGFDPNYTMYAFEHVDLSRRIYNAGLTSSPYMDIKGSINLFYSYDYHSLTQSAGDRTYFKENKKRFLSQKRSRDYIPYKLIKMKNVIFSSFFNYSPDPQRLTRKDGVKFDKPDGLKTLIDSCNKNKQHLFIFHNGIDGQDSKYIHYRTVEPSRFYSPNNYRWIVYKKFFDQGFECENIFMVDSTDVELINPPFKHIKNGVLYCGSEYYMRVENSWMQGQRRNTNIPDYMKVINPFKDRTLLNCGIVGGNFEIIKEYLTKISEVHNKYTRGVMHSLDMTAFNYTVLKYFSDRYEIGSHINTIFKGYEYDNKTAWFRHK